MNPIKRMAGRTAFLRILLLFASAGLLSGPAAARPRIVVDFAGENGQVATTGDSWVLTSNATVCGLASTAAASCGVTFANNSSVAVKLGFQVHIGAASYDSLFINKNGFVTFGSALTGNFVPAANITAVQQAITANGTVTRPFIAPFYRLMSMPDVTTTFAPFGGGASYFRASGDPLTPFSVPERLPAFAVTWIDDNFNLNPQVMTQLVLYSAGANGDFYLRLRHGQSDTDQFTGLAGGSLVTGLMADAFQLASTLGGATANLNDYFFVFRNGHLVPSVDSDVDGTLDGVDNCTLVPNTEAGTVPNSGVPGVPKYQLDSDQDGYGNACDADINNSGGTTASDYAILRSVIGQLYNFSVNAARSDINGSGSVTAADYAILRSRIGAPLGPSGLGCAGTIPCPSP